MKNQERKLEETREYNKSEKGRAAQQLRDAVRQGKIERQPCEICREPEAQGHHFDYSKPLEVRWLCPTHHREEHLFEPWQNEMRRAGYKGGFLLGQLIEACPKFIADDRGMGGQCIFSLSVWEGEWNAMYDICDYQPLLEGNGSTPEEAVAMLWLALFKSPAIRQEHPNAEAQNSEARTDGDDGVVEEVRV